MKAHIKWKKLYFIASGDAVKRQYDPSLRESRTILKLGIGSWIGEESIIFNKNIEFDVAVSSNKAELYSINKKEFE